jgi:hypothetical protein
MEFQKRMRKYYDLFNLIYFNMKTIKNLINKLFTAKPEQSLLFPCLQVDGEIANIGQ